MEVDPTGLMAATQGLAASIAGVGGAQAVHPPLGADPASVGGAARLSAAGTQLASLLAGQIAGLVDSTAQLGLVGVGFQLVDDTNAAMIAALRGTAQVIPGPGGKAPAAPPVPDDVRPPLPAAPATRGEALAQAIHSGDAGAGEEFASSWQGVSAASKDTALAVRSLVARLPELLDTPRAAPAVAAHLLGYAEGFETTSQRAALLADQARGHAAEFQQVRQDIPTPEQFVQSRNRVTQIAVANARSGGRFAVPLAEAENDHRKLDVQTNATFVSYYEATDAATGRIVSTEQPYGLPAGTNTYGYGGPGQDKFPQWVRDLGAKYGVQPSTYPGHQEYGGLNHGIDWVGTAPAGSPEAAAQMDRFAKALAASKPDGLQQVIWQNPFTGERTGLTPDGRVVKVGGEYYRDDWGEHRDHVHTSFYKAVRVGPGGAGLDDLLGSGRGHAHGAHGANAHGVLAHWADSADSYKQPLGALAQKLPSMIPTAMGTAGGLLGGLVSSVTALPQVASQAVSAATSALTGSFGPSLGMSDLINAGTGLFNAGTGLGADLGAFGADALGGIDGLGAGGATAPAGGHLPPAMMTSAMAPTMASDVASVSSGGATSGGSIGGTAAGAPMPMGMPLGAGGAAGGNHELGRLKRIATPELPHSEVVTGKIDGDKAAVAALRAEGTGFDDFDHDPFEDGAAAVRRIMAAPLPEDRL